MSEDTNTPVYVGEIAGSEEACSPGGNYGLCKTHSTCELVRARIEKLEAVLEAARQFHRGPQPGEETHPKWDDGAMGLPCRLCDAIEAAKEKQ